MQKWLIQWVCYLWTAYPELQEGAEGSSGSVGLVGRLTDFYNHCGTISTRARIINYLSKYRIEGRGPLVQQALMSPYCELRLPALQAIVSLDWGPDTQVRSGTQVQGEGRSQRRLDECLLELLQKPNQKRNLPNRPDGTSENIGPLDDEGWHEKLLANKAVRSLSWGSCDSETGKRIRDKLGHALRRLIRDSDSTLSSQSSVALNKIFGRRKIVAMLVDDGCIHPGALTNIADAIRLLSVREGVREIRGRRGQEYKDNLRKLLEQIGGQDAVEELLEHYRKESSDQRERSRGLRESLERMKEKVERSYSWTFWMSVICFGIGVVLVFSGLLVSWNASKLGQKLAAATGIGVGLGTPAIIIPLLVGSTKRLQAACNSLVRGQMASHVFATQMLQIDTAFTHKMEAMANGWGNKDAEGPDASRLMKELREAADAVRMAALVLESGEGGGSRSGTPLEEKPGAQRRRGVRADLGIGLVQWCGVGAAVRGRTNASG